MDSRIFYLNKTVVQLLLAELPMYLANLASQRS